MHCHKPIGSVNRHSVGNICDVSVVPVFKYDAPQPKQANLKFWPGVGCNVNNILGLQCIPSVSAAVPNCVREINIILAQAFVCLVYLNCDLFGAGNVLFYVYTANKAWICIVIWNSYWSYGATFCLHLIVCCFMSLLHEAFNGTYCWTPFCMEGIQPKGNHPQVSQVTCVLLLILFSFV